MGRRRFEDLARVYVSRAGDEGETSIEPRAGHVSVTQFSSAYALIGWEQGNWRLAARADDFRTHASSALSENGYALTGDVSWLPREWLRLSAEILYIDSKRNERSIVEVSPQQGETHCSSWRDFIFRTWPLVRHLAGSQSRSSRIT